MSGPNALKLKKTRIRRHIKEKIRRPFQKFFFRVDRKMMIEAFRRVGLKEGATVCVHSSLGRIGFVAGGPNDVIDALIETVGPKGCVMMPSFPITTSMVDYLENGPIFDVKKSPSASSMGVITEVFRQRPGVYRSLHPTHPVAAWGYGAKHLLQDHEKSITPFGSDTPYGRLATLDNGFLLMMETNVQSFLHHLQEKVNLPTLFYEKPIDAYYIDWQGVEKMMRTKVMRPPGVQYFIAIPSSEGSEPDWAIIIDYTLMFPRRREGEIKQLGYRFKGYPRLWNRRDELVKAGILKIARLGRGEIGLIHLKQFLNKFEPELLELIDRYYPFYKPDNIAKLRLPII
jgi:aminoglycoside 3-N-acetyltransferase